MDAADAFMAEICAAPEDDLPRLVFADWLLEYGGQPERAEFIRLQCSARAGRPPEDRLRDRQLWTAHGHRWLLPIAMAMGFSTEPSDYEPLPHRVYKQFGLTGGCVRDGSRRCWWKFRRGFLDYLELSAEEWLRVHKAVYWHPDQSYQAKWSAARIARPFVATAQPITRVKLTTRPLETPGWYAGGHSHGGHPTGRGTFVYDRWPTIEFDLSRIGETAHA